MRLGYEYDTILQYVHPDKMAFAPNTGTITAGTRASCASSIADHEYSIAAHTTGGLSENYFVQAALGNSVSGLYDLWNSPSIGEGLSNLVKGGYNPGIPLGSFSNPIEGGVGGVITNGLIKAGISNVSKASVDEIAGPVGLAKLAYDLGSFGYAYAFDCR